jgi:hypothetical protein
MFNYTKLNPSQIYALASSAGPQFVVIDNFLGPTQSALVRKACVKMDEDGLLQDSNMGKGNTKWASKKSRGDRLLWLTSIDPKDVPDPIRKCIRSLQAVQKSLIKEVPHLNLGKRISIQLACYPGNGTGYVRHTDAFRNNNPNETKRKITALYYMNPDWEEAHGGQLRAYYDKPEKYWDVEPKMDRLLLFRSDIVPHEVLPSHAMRYALTCWMYTSLQETKAKEAGQVKVSVIKKSTTTMSTTNPIDITDATTTTTTTTTTSTTTTTPATISNSENFTDQSPSTITPPAYPITYGLQMLENSTIAAWGDPHNISSATLKYDAQPLPIPTELSNNCSSKKELIFVSIACYRDCECQHTVESLFAASKYPDRLRIGICFQYDSTADQNCFSTIPMIRPHQVKVMHVPSSEAKGPCWARYLAEQMYNNEKYTLQLDSHMRMRPNWDVYLIHALNLCKTKKSILTSYPLGYELPNKIIKNDIDVTILCADHFDNDGMLRIIGKRLKGGSSSTTTTIQIPCNSLFWASGFSFSRGSLLMEVPYDPNLSHLFFGEEISMASRMYTHGWNFYTPMDAVVYHLWDRSYRPTVREIFSKEVQELRVKSQQKVHCLLGMLNDNEEKVKLKRIPYGLGTVRTLEEFETYCGVSFKTREIYSRGKRGGQLDGAYRGDEVTSASKVMKLLQLKGMLNDF